MGALRRPLIHLAGESPRPENRHLQALAATDESELTLRRGRLPNRSHQLRPLADEEAAAPQQVAGLAFGGGIDVGEWEVASAKEAGEGGGVLAVVFRLAAV